MWRVLLVLFEVVFLILPVSWYMVQVFTIKVIWPAEYRDIMRSIARREMEIYGYVVSSSVEWWLKDNNVDVCKAHPGLLYGRSGVISGGIVYCECPPNYTDVYRHYSELRHKPVPPRGPGSASSGGGYILADKLPPPNPGLGVSESCYKKCDDYETIWADGREVARWCHKHGKVVPPADRMPVHRYPPPPPPPIGGLTTPTRPSPTRGERR